MAQLATSLGSHSAPASTDAWDRPGEPSAWIWLPILFLLCGFRFSLGTISLGLSGLWLPIAAWLGARHGRTGFLIVAIAGAPLLVQIGYGGLITTARDVGLYVGALLLCRLFGQSGYRADCLAAAHLPPRAFAFLFLVLPVVVGYVNRFGPLQLGATWTLWTYLMLVLMVIGLGASPLRPVLVLLIVASVAGMALLALGGIPSFLDFYLGYGLDGTADIVTGAIALWLGRAVIRPRLVGEKAAAVSAIAALTLLLIIASGIELRGLGGWRGALQFGSGLANAMLLFACGFALGGRGVAIAVVVWALATALPCAILFSGAPEAMFRPIAWGNLVLQAPPGLVGTSYAVAPVLAIAPLEPLFAVFGWLAVRALGGGRPAVPVVDAPPPLRYRRLDRILPWVCAAILALAVGLTAFFQLS